MIAHKPEAAQHTEMFNNKAFKRITKKEERDLFVAARGGSDAARRRLIESNARFAGMVARHYQGRGLDLADLTSEAILGLTRAVDRYDHATGYKFITYAVWWIRQGILAALARQGRAIAVPPSVMAGVKKVERARNRLEQRNGRAPTLEAVARATGMKEKAALESMLLKDSVLSLDMPVLADEDGTLMDCLADDRFAADKDVLEKDDHRYLEDLLGCLKPAERRVLRAYYGLDTGLEGLKLQDVGVQMGLTRERVRQIKETALARLRRRLKVSGNGGARG
jgi:RNA polymerase primary sigma factor